MGMPFGKFGLAAIAVMFLAAGFASAQPNPQAPTLNMPAPMGMQRGTSLEMTLIGTNLSEPTALWTSFPARVTFPHSKSDDASHLRVRLDVPATAPLGFQAIRLATRRGLSNLRIFCIDDLTQV